MFFRCYAIFLVSITSFSFPSESLIIDLDPIGSNQYLLNSLNSNILESLDYESIIFNQSHHIPYGNFSGLNIFGKKDKTYYHFRDEDNNQSYLFNKIGKIKGFPIFSKSNVDIIFENNQDMITCVGDDNEILLYTIN